MTVESCVAFCSGKNYIYAGVEYAQECCECTFSLFFISILPITVVLLTLRFECQIVEISSRMAQRLLQVRIVVLHVLAIRVRLVVPAIVLTCIGVVRLPRRHLKSSQALERGNHWGAIRTCIYFPFLDERASLTCLTFANSDGNPRVLSIGTTPVGGAASNSVESCTAACSAAGYPLAGVEYSDECCMLIYSFFWSFLPLIGFFVKTAVPLSAAMAPLHQQLTATWFALGVALSSVVDLSASTFTTILVLLRPAAAAAEVVVVEVEVGPLIFRRAGHTTLAGCTFLPILGRSILKR